jgi:hypothetical protein
VWVRDLLHKGGRRPVAGRVGYLRLCPLATRGEWIFICAPFLRPDKPRLSERLAYRGVEIVENRGFSDVW